MLLNVFHIAVMALVFLYMFNTARFTRTRLVALVALATALVDICSVKADFTAIPVLALLLAVMRLVILGCCFAAMRQDRAAARARDRQRMRRRMVLRTAAIERTRVNNACEMPQYA